MCGRDHSGLPRRDERVERRGVVVLVPAHMRVPEVALGGLAVGHQGREEGGGNKGRGYSAAAPDICIRGSKRVKPPPGMVHKDELTS
jgi:hypothetical protein